MIAKPFRNFPVCTPYKIFNILKFQHRGIDVCILAYIYLSSINLHSSNYFPSSLNGRYTDALFLVFFTYAYNLTSHNFYHTLDCSIGFFPYFTVTTFNKCDTLVQIQLSHVKLGNRSSCFNQMVGEDTKLDSLEFLVFDLRP